MHAHAPTGYAAVAVPVPATGATSKAHPSLEVVGEVIPSVPSVHGADATALHVADVVAEWNDLIETRFPEYDILDWKGQMFHDAAVTIRDQCKGWGMKAERPWVAWPWPGSSLGALPAERMDGPDGDNPEVFDNMKRPHLAPQVHLAYQLELLHFICKYSNLQMRSFICRWSLQIP